MLISKRNLRYIMTAGIGITKNGVRLLGMSYPLKSEWMKNVSSMEVDKNKFLALAEVARTK